jgi:WD40 repeat protein
MQELRFADYSPDGRRIAASYVDGSVRLWRSDGTLIANLSGHLGPVVQVRFSPDGSRLLTASQDGACRFWFVDSEELLRYARGLVSGPIAEDARDLYDSIRADPARAVGAAGRVDAVHGR